eukprot:5626226-Amphidinium_carterae.2
MGVQKTSILPFWGCSRNGTSMLKILELNYSALEQLRAKVTIKQKELRQGNIKTVLVKCQE